MKKFLSVLGGVLLPAMAFAQVSSTSPSVGNILTTVKSIFNVIIPMLITVGIIFFIYGVITYVTAGDEDKRKEGRQRMIYGIIGLFVIISIWGLVGILGSTFGIQQGGTLQNYQIPNVTP